MDHKEYLSEIGKRGGKSQSPAKIAAVRANGQKGGRPKGSKDSTPRKGSKNKSKIIENNS
jgi:hypothetical protein